MTHSLSVQAVYGVNFVNFTPILCSIIIWMKKYILHTISVVCLCDKSCRSSLLGLWGTVSISNHIPWFTAGCDYSSMPLIEWWSDQKFIVHICVILSSFEWNHPVRVTHIYIYVITLAISGSDNYVSPIWHQAIVWTNCDILSIEQINFSAI